MGINNINCAYKKYFDLLDAKDGKKDGKIRKDIWNAFASTFGGKQIKNYILPESAIKEMKNFGQNPETKAIIEQYFAKKNKTTTPPQKNTPTPASACKESPHFGELTAKNLKKEVKHSTHFLDVASKYLGKYEITPSEYAKMTPEQKAIAKKETQLALMKQKGQIWHAWCAHSVSSIAQEAGIDIGGYKREVQEFINWGKKNGNYQAISTNSMNANNYIEERASRAKQIKQQLPQMQEGDFIIWKTRYFTPVANGKNSTPKPSHIGIIESVDTKNGTVTVLEGNANYSRTRSKDGALYKVTKTAEGVNGDQKVNEYQEINRRDGFIRKTYTIEELAARGYSGYIDNSSRIPKKQ